MIVEFLNTKCVQLRLGQFIDEYDEFHWAVAWGSYTPLAKHFLKHRSKFRDVTFGVAFSQTDPELIDGLVGVRNAYVATKFSDGTYHPKVYCFRSGKNVAAIIGSNNFTRGGLDKNLEAALSIVGTIDEHPFGDLLQFVRTSASFGQRVNGAYAAKYRSSYKHARGMAKPRRDPVSKNTTTTSLDFVKMGWTEYVKRIRESSVHDANESLELLGTVRHWFSAAPSFANFTSSQRKAVAGILGESEKSESELDRDWGWFGSMRGAGDFANRIRCNDRSIAKAVNSIPRSGEVTHAQYERFCDLFGRAFANSKRTGGVATASRLLAMKRPDTFLCVCKPNVIAAAQTLGFARTTLDLENYWERVIEPIRFST